jgi:hypothetical protein
MRGVVYIPQSFGAAGTRNGILWKTVLTMPWARETRSVLPLANYLRCLTSAPCSSNSFHDVRIQERWIASSPNLDRLVRPRHFVHEDIRTPDFGNLSLGITSVLYWTALEISLTRAHPYR